VNADLIRELLITQRDQADRAVRHRIGVVTAVSPLAVDLGNSGVVYTSVSSRAGYAPAVGDVVSVLAFGNDLLVQSKLASGSKSGAGVFSAYRAAALSLTTGSAIVFDSEERDLSGWYDTTNGRFTPQIAGYYRLSWLAGSLVLPAAGELQAILHKNGALFKRMPPSVMGSGGSGAFAGGSVQVQANGTTDFFQVFFYHTAGGALALFLSGSDTCRFDGEMICG
jgi:hypothetical protein